MSKLGEQMVRVLEVMIGNAVRRTEETVSQIQTQVLEIDSLSGFQRQAIDEVKGAAAQTAAEAVMERLQGLAKSNSELGEVIMPIIVALQFQDRLSQDLSSLLKAFVRFSRAIEETNGGRQVEENSFWATVAKEFTNIESRTLILKAALGEDYQNAEVDIRKSAELGNTRQRKRSAPPAA